MKKTTIMLITLAVLLVLATGCASTTEVRTTLLPHSASVSFPGEGYKILGRVEYAGAKGKSGYLSFLEYAKSVYPTADDVVNIMVDSEQTVETTTETFLLMPSVKSKTTYTYTMTGIAIEYLGVEL